MNGKKKRRTLKDLEEKFDLLEEVVKVIALRDERGRERVSNRVHANAAEATRILRRIANAEQTQRKFAEVADENVETQRKDHKELGSVAVQVDVQRHRLWDLQERIKCVEEQLPKNEREKRLQAESDAIVFGRANPSQMKSETRMLRQGEGLEMGPTPAGMKLSECANFTDKTSSEKAIEKFQALYEKQASNLRLVEGVLRSMKAKEAASKRTWTVALIALAGVLTGTGMIFGLEYFVL